jgi:hypothetical protein
VWMPKKKETPVPTHPGTENPSSSKQWRGRQSYS